MGLGTNNDNNYWKPALCSIFTRLEVIQFVNDLWLSMCTHYSMTTILLKVPFNIKKKHKLKWYERQISWNFWIKYFHLISHLILTKINCITLQIRSKADFKSKSQNIWQQIILFSRTVKDMRATQDLNSFGEIIAHAQCSVDEKKLNIYSVCTT